jgi:hypothetical protein
LNFDREETRRRSISTIRVQFLHSTNPATHM